MKYCPVDQDISHPWSNGGLAPCFNDTVATSIVFGLAVLLSLCQFCLYYRHSSRNVAHQLNLRKTKLFLLHIIIHVLLIAIPLATLFSYVYYVQSGAVFIYQIVASLFEGKCYKLVPASLQNPLPKISCI